jgi:hypothetical protein
VSRSQESQDRAAETNARVLILALVAVLVAIGLFWLAEHDAWFEKIRPVQVTMEQVAGLIVATGLLTAAWELVGKRRFAAEVLEKAKLSTDVTNSGLTRVTDRHHQDVPWGDLFAGTTLLDIAIPYARTWRNTHADSLRKLAAKRDGHLRVFLPDPDDRLTMESLAHRFKETRDDITKTVREAVIEYSKLDRRGGGGVEVWVRPGEVSFSCYRFDKKAAVIALYSHSRERPDWTSTPVLIAGKGHLFRFVNDELEEIKKQSRRVYP